MRHQIRLYIGDKEADLSDNSFVLLNIRQDDLSNPTIVRNSFSQSITLPGTPNNNAIFGDYFQLDRVVDPLAGLTGAGFDPTRKTPFTLYDGTDGIPVSGYIKLDSVTWRRNIPAYKVTLYGGLGSFLYALSYSEDGNKRTLADLDYLGTGNPESELDFTINASTVGTAWGTVQDGMIDDIWKVLNFAPCYDGLPDNFSADKFIGVPSAFGLPDTQGSYTLNNSVALFNLAEPADGWKMREFRSYLQRPVISVRSIMEAISKPGNNGGYLVDYSDVSGCDFMDAWITLPLLPSLTPPKTGGGLALDTINAGTGQIDIIGTVPAGANVTVGISAYLNIEMMDPAAQSETYLVSSVEQMGLYNMEGKFLAIFAQLVAYDNANNVMGASNIRSWFDYNIPARDMATACGYTPTIDTAYENAESKLAWMHAGAGVFTGPEASFTLTAQYVDHYVLEVESYIVETERIGGVDVITSVSSYSPTLWKDFSTPFTGFWDFASGSVPDSISVEGNSSIRSNAKITKAMLLSTSSTPADYLLSICKTFGFYMLCDEAEKTVTILGRNSLYRNEVKDLTRRVDVKQGYTINPITFNAKWYDFDPEVVEGAFAKEYADLYGIPYGIQRVNTGFPYNADANNLLEGTVLRSAVSRMRRSKWFNYIISNTKYIPSAFIDKGNTYTLWDSAGETAEFEISGPPLTASVTYDNATYNGYDGADRPEFADAANKAVDGRDVLLWWDGDQTIPYGDLTDDTADMDTLNGGPCWLVSGRVYAGVTIPHFTRYKIVGGVVSGSLDFGRPKELGLPGVTYPDNVTVYRKCWAAYLADKYNRDTKVLKCRVNLGGMQVGRDLLRRFYHFGGAEWVLNAIENHSMTTFDPTECEFVQVQDKGAYLTDQNL